MNNSKKICMTVKNKRTFLLYMKQLVFWSYITRFCKFSQKWTRTRKVEKQTKTGFLLNLPKLCLNLFIFIILFEYTYLCWCKIDQVIRRASSTCPNQRNSEKLLYPTKIHNSAWTLPSTGLHEVYLPRSCCSCTQIQSEWNNSSNSHCWCHSYLPFHQRHDWYFPRCCIVVY